MGIQMNYQECVCGVELMDCEVARARDMDLG